MQNINILIFAYLGGLAANIFRLLELRRVPIAERPNTFKDPLYWIQFIVVPVIGGILAYAYSISGTTLSPILALHIGVSAPLIFKQMMSQIPSVSTEVD